MADLSHALATCILNRDARPRTFSVRPVTAKLFIQNTVRRQLTWKNGAHEANKVDIVVERERERERAGIEIKLT